LQLDAGAIESPTLQHLDEHSPSTDFDADLTKAALEPYS
jgi:hypothetical protein